MADEVFHVPQQSRRQVLRAVDQNNSYPPPQLSPFTPAAMSSPQHLPFPLHFSEHDHYRGEFRSSVPLGPFTGYTLILKRSRFLKPAQQLLEDFCESDRSDSDPPPINYLGGRAKDPLSDRVELQFKNSKLSIMLEEVYNKYKLYCQQMESVVASFEAIDGLGNAAPYISFAIKSILKHFGCLKNAILDKLQSKGKRTLPCDFSQDPSHHNFTSNILHQLDSRSQRGLPESAVAVLRTWLFEHFLHPYPSDSEKHMLAQQTGLSRTQVSNWFINSRVRLWKPMVEEIHNLESQQSQKLSVSDSTSRDVRIASLCASSIENPLHSGTSPQTKRSRTIKHRDNPKRSETQRNAVHGSSTSNFHARTDSHETEISLALSLQARK